MSRRKEDQGLIPKDSNNNLGTLSSVTTHSVFTPSLHKSNIMQLAQKARDCVIFGDPTGLSQSVKQKPKVLFEKGQATDLRSRIYPDISAYQLILFYCDKDMKNRIKPYIPERLDERRKAQEKEMGKGGNDLIKLDRDPLTVAGEDFKGITEFETTYTLFGTQTTVTFPIMENEDCIIFYQDTKNEIHFYYYTNQKPTELKELNASINSDEDKADFDKFKASFKDMENNSGRRSSHEEHQLIEKLLGYTLQRQGIEYEHQGKRYRDSVSPFNLINAYRTWARLYEEAERNNQRSDLWNKVHAYWRTGVGKAQGEEIWILQRICEAKKPGYPNANLNNFDRELVFFNPTADNYKHAFSNGKLVIGLGSEFALYNRGGYQDRPRGDSDCPGMVVDLIAVLRLVKDAKANIIELEHDQSPHVEETTIVAPQ